MDKDLAKLILDTHKDAIWPYLQLRALHAKDGHVSEDTSKVRGIDSTTMRTLSISGFIRVTSGKVLLARDDGTWLYLPETPAKRPEAKSSNWNTQLERIAKLAGWPVDFEQNRGYYSAQLRRLRDNYSFDTIETIAYDNQGMGLKSFLVNSVFKSLLVKFEAESRD